MFKLFFCIACYIFTTPGSDAEVFTAISELDPLIETLGTVVNDLESYMQREKKRLTILEKQLYMYKMEYISTLEDRHKYLENPINSFKLIKRLTVDLDFTERNIEYASENAKSVEQCSDDLMFPTMEDLTGSMLALTRLQDTYELEVSELAGGRLAGEKCSTPMTASDCFKIGHTLYEHKKYELSLQWLKEALRKYETENDVYDVSLIDILKYISQSYHNLMLEWNEKILKLNPNNAEVLNDIVNFQKTIDKNRDILQRGNRSDTEEYEDPYTSKILAHEKKVYEALCRGDIEIPEVIKKRLTCTYLMGKNPFLKLAPIKMEQLYLRPDIFMFHQVISDNEIEHLKNIAKAKLKRATVLEDDGNTTPTYHRITKSAWFSDLESTVVRRISRRVSHFTGLDMDTSEFLQIANYGIGGYYQPHFDFTLKFVNTDTSFRKNVGNRIATVLFYMSEVPQGGATVFTELGLSVFPVKNSALFWMNLHPSGEGNVATRHAACPVLRGSKWVSNKWIHQVGQELLKPCNLEYQKEYVTGKDPIPMKVKTKDKNLRRIIYNWYHNVGIEKLTNRALEQYMEAGENN